MYEQVVESLQKLGHFPKEQIALFTEKLRVLEVNKNSTIIKEGQVCQNIYFVNKGCFRHYHVNEDGIESTLSFFLPNEWMLEYKSFISQQPSQNFICATTTGQLLAMSVCDLHALIKTSESFFRIGKILEQSFQSQDYQNSKLTPEEKYELLMENRPEVLQQFPLKHIASYLAVTPETLSRVRKKIIS